MNTFCDSTVPHNYEAGNVPSWALEYGHHQPHVATGQLTSDQWDWETKYLILSNLNIKCE